MAALFSFLVAMVPATAQPLPLIKGAQSAYIIYRAPNAPKSVIQASGELQRVIRLATGATLPIRTAPATPMVALGDNPSARAAGINAAALPPEAFQVVTKDRDCFIVGNDTPDGQKTPGGGFSNGTLFGIYKFLEKHLGVRWLMPGEWGEDIPQQRDVAIPATPWQGQPDFASREIAYVHNTRPDVITWKLRNGLGRSVQVSHGHTWDEMPPVSVLKEHPEYMALLNGKRAGPAGLGRYYKFCTTNQDLVRAFADSVIAWFDKNPTMAMCSISPTDGDNWCECENCRALDVHDDKGQWLKFGSYGISRTKRLLKFYKDVAEIVARERPGKLLGGYVYASYTYPPDEPIELPSNLFLVLALRPYYAYALYRPVFQEQNPRLIAAWGKIAPSLGYYDASTWMRDYYGAPLPPALSIMKQIFPLHKKAGTKSMFYYGQSAWGYGALHNYLVAHLLWDANTDIDKLAHEWLERAYGPGAAAIEEIYTLADRDLAEYIRNQTALNTDLTGDMVLKVYLKNFDTIENRYREALAKAATEPQRRRLQMFGDNLAVLHFNLRKAGVLPHPEASIFYKDDAEFQTFYDAARKTLALAEPQGGENNVTLKGPYVPQLFVPEQRTLAIPRLPAGVAAPQIDGDLTDAAWQHAAVADAFRLAGSREPSKQLTTARVIYDDKYLYVSFLCQEDRIGALQKQTAERDAMTIFHDDVVELFLSPVGDAGRFWHIAINPLNTQWDAFMTANPKDNLEWQSATKIGENAWTVEIAIPFAGLETHRAFEGQTWRVNLTRQRKPQSENSSWNSVEDGFQNPQGFGAWSFYAIK